MYVNAYKASNDILHVMKERNANINGKVGTLLLEIRLNIKVEN